MFSQQLCNFLQTASQPALSFAGSLLRSKHQKNHTQAFVNAGGKKKKCHFWQNWAGKKKPWQDFLFSYFQTVGGKQRNVCLEFCVALAAMKREFLEGKNLSFVLLLPSSVLGKSVLAGCFALFLFSSQICHLHQTVLIQIMDPKVMVKKMPVIQEALLDFW